MQRGELLWRVAARLLVVGWLGILLVGLGWGAVVVSLDDLYCEYESGDSNYGDMSWSIVPPGPQCSWTGERHGVDDARGPTPVMSAWLLALVVLGGATLWTARRAWAPRTVTVDDS